MAIGRARALIINMGWLLTIATVVQHATDGQPMKDSVRGSRSSSSQGNGQVSTDPLRYYYQRGQRVIWRDDFRNDEAGAFPQRMRLVSGHFEVKGISGRNYLWTVDSGVIDLNLPQTLPRRFSIEFEYDSPRARAPFIVVMNSDKSDPACSLGSLNHESFLECGGNRSEVRTSLPGGGRIHPRFTIDGEHVSAYINEQLLPPLPDAGITRGRRLQLHIPGGTPEHPTLITVIHVAEGGIRETVVPAKFRRWI